MIDVSIIIAILTLTSGFTLIIDKLIRDPEVEFVRNQIIVWWINLQEDFSFRKIAKQSNIQFINLFNAIYGKRHISFKSFRRSLVSSTFAYLICISFILIFHKTYFNNLISAVQNFDSFILKVAFILTTFILPIFLFNILIDYISLIETRIILKFSINSSLRKLLIFLVLDIIFSGLLCFFLLVTLRYLWTYYAEPGSFENLIWLVFAEISENHPMTASVFFSSFFTSAIFYLLFATNLILAFISTMRKPIIWILYRLGSVNNPITAVVGVLSGLILILKSIQLLFTG